MAVMSSRTSGEHPEVLVAGLELRRCEIAPGPLDRPLLPEQPLQALAAYAGACFHRVVLADPGYWYGSASPSVSGAGRG